MGLTNTLISGNTGAGANNDNRKTLKCRTDGALIVSPSSKIATASFTRLANTTAYADGDAVSSDATTPVAISLACGRLVGLGGVITHAMLLSSVAGTAVAFDLYLFSAALAATSWRDNLAVAVTDAELLTLQMVIPFASADSVTAGANRVLGRADVGKVFQCAAADTNLYALIVARGAYAPASGEVLTVVLGVAQD
jgi:hypothetical protein